MSFEFPDDAPNGPKLLEALARGHGVHQNKGVAFAYGKTLHRRELVRPRCVRDLECAYVFIATYNLKPTRFSSALRVTDTARGSPQSPNYFVVNRLAHSFMDTIWPQNSPPFSRKIVFHRVGKTLLNYFCLKLDFVQSFENYIKTLGMKK